MHFNSSDKHFQNNIDKIKGWHGVEGKVDNFAGLLFSTIVKNNNIFLVSFLFLLCYLENNFSFGGFFKAEFAPLAFSDDRSRLETQILD